MHVAIYSMSTIAVYCVNISSYVASWAEYLVASLQHSSAKTCVPSLIKRLVTSSPLHLPHYIMSTTIMVLLIINIMTYSIASHVHSDLAGCGIFIWLLNNASLPTVRLATCVSMATVFPCYNNNNYKALHTDTNSVLPVNVSTTLDRAM